MDFLNQWPAAAVPERRRGVVYISNVTLAEIWSEIGNVNIDNYTDKIHCSKRVDSRKSCMCRLLMG